jgi:hypothetical protein
MFFSYNKIASAAETISRTARRIKIKVLVTSRRYAMATDFLFIEKHAGARTIGT